MVIVQDMEYIFLDELFNNLDMKYFVEIMKLLKCFVEDLDKMIVIVIYDINFVFVYLDYIVVFKNGEVICEGLIEIII